ncbi:hypothetical protein Esti_004854 [Eimeria stiedai]
MKKGRQTRQQSSPAAALAKTGAAKNGFRGHKTGSSTSSSSSSCCCHCCSGGLVRSNGSSCMGPAAEGRERPLESLRQRSLSAEPRASGELLRALGRDRLTVVIKVGTSTLMDPRAQTPSFSLSNIGKLVDTVCLLRAKGASVVLVTSGAVGAGCVSLHLKQRPTCISAKQALAAVGQCRLMRLYEDLFSVREVRVGQLLVSRNDFLRQRTYANFRNCLRSLIDLEVVPILNENDSICTEELRFGDNDTLAAHCAVALEADFLFILTDVDCLYTKNPRQYTEARPVWFVDRFTDVYSYLSVDEGEGGWGTGGIHTKVVASKIATNLGVHVGIVHGAFPERVLDVFDYVARNLVPNNSAAPLAATPFPMPAHPETPPAAAAAAATAAAQGALHPHPDLNRELLEETGGRPSSSSSSSSLRQSRRFQRDARGGSLDACNVTSGAALGRQPNALLLRNGSNSAAGAAAGAAAQPFREDSVPPGSFPRRAQKHVRMQQQQQHDAWRHHPSVSFSVPGEGTLQASPPPFIGTIFVSQAPSGPSQSMRLVRRWILALPVRGTVYVDLGCARSLVLLNKSLFAAGVKEVHGTFVAGECLSVFLYGFETSGGSLSAEIGRCISSVSSRELDIIKGHRSNDFEQLLGYTVDQEVAHRHDLVLVYRNGDERLQRICEGREEF